MTLIFKQLFNFLKLLNSDTGHNQLAAGLACGLILGFAPFLSLQTVLVLMLVFVFRIQMGAAFLSAFFFKFIAYLVDPLSHQLGKGVLENPSLRDLFVEMYNMPIVPMTRFNNSIVMGSLVLSVVLAPFAFFAFRTAIIKYRILIVDRFKKTKAWKAFTATTIYNWYCKYDALYG
ncbi:MAG: TIGR03546 family protein [Bdellovibrionaceae bacterium]|nr:TIGR03546 family protein [Pseudobdellovibrionaceae bacterium]